MNSELSIKVIRILVRLGLYLQYLSVVVVSIIFILHLLSIELVNNVKIDFPVGVHYELPGTIREVVSAEVEFEEATIDIALSDVSLAIFIAHIFSILLVLLIAIYCTRLFLRSIDSIAGGNIFNKDNINRFQRIGIVLIVTSFFSPFYTVITLGVLNPSFEGVKFQFEFMPDWSLLLSGLFLVTMSEVFKAGLRYKNENELTI